MTRLRHQSWRWIWLATLALLLGSAAAPALAACAVPSGCAPAAARAETAAPTACCLPGAGRAVRSASHGCCPLPDATAQAADDHSAGCAMHRAPGADSGAAPASEACVCAGPAAPLGQLGALNAGARPFAPVLAPALDAPVVSAPPHGWRVTRTDTPLPRQPVRSAGPSRAPPPSPAA